jgi:prevent-host-death family protein
MSNTWQLQEAKSKFSRVVEVALSDGPQVVTRRGTDTVVFCHVLSTRVFS